jgi:LacI family transcriptional regulator
MRYSDYLQVPLSSIDQNTVELGRSAANRALELDKDPGQQPRSILIEPKLMVRRSSQLS